MWPRRASIIRPPRVSSILSLPRPGGNIVLSHLFVYIPLFSIFFGVQTLEASDLIDTNRKETVTWHSWYHRCRMRVSVRTQRSSV